ncbi:F-box/LRR-repeat protein 20-like protein [Leptotrombidium deliense]|uniref:F-box/LRR-repeat protein 20-like protein n=1 Tax=Leptotrombidium deliense TaxID=299467 RepID=A0A443ST74_9ACAR|nr:F-box/LRR-repeat protein 20-like protein [Leptotrombidium deliense]
MWSGLQDISSAALLNVNTTKDGTGTLQNATVCFQGNTIDKIPDKVLLKIFAYLPHSQVGRLARVCKKWRMMSCDSRLWTHVSLRPEISGLHVTSMESLLALISIRFGPSLKYIELPMELITHTVLHELANKCPNLTHMLLDFSTAMQLHDFNDLHSFPTKLRTMCICLSEVIFMEGFMRKIYNFINGLEVLHLIGTYEKAVEDEEEEIHEVINMHKLKSAVPNLRVTNLQELDITATELSSDCLIDLLTRLPPLRFLSAGQQDGFNDVVLKEYMERGNIKSLIAFDVDRNENISEEVLLQFLRVQGPNLRGLQLSGIPHLTEQFWTSSLPLFKHMKILIMGMPEGCCQKVQSKVHIDSLMDGIANNCPYMERIEARWDSETLRFSDRSSKAVDAIRIKCPRLRSLTLSDGKYFEMVKSNFERADRLTVVRSITNYMVTLVYLLHFYKDLIFN